MFHKTSGVFRIRTHSIRNIIQRRGFQSSIITHKPKLSKTLITVGVSVTLGISYHNYKSSLIQNDILKYTSQLEPATDLKPNPKGDTYENGLFLSSQQELEDEVEEYRKERLSRKLGFIFKIGFTFHDYIWEPLVTVGRFIELTIIFLPIILTIPVSWFGKKDPLQNNERSGSIIWYKILRFSLENAGASFIKLGQWAASRTDIFPQQFCEELGNLHSNAKKHSIGYTKRILSQSFGGLPFDEIFEEFNENPVGVGAIAQVYLATLSKKLIENIDEFQPATKRKGSLFGLSSLISNDDNIPEPNQKVAIKVIHPNAATKIKRDLKIMNFFANAIDIIPTMEWLSLPDEVRNFDILMNLQLDLRIEGLNLNKFQENYKDDLFVNFPKPYLKFSNRSILVEEYINGLSMSKILELKNSGNLNDEMSKQLSEKVIDSFLQMLILNNFIHSDLHAGNIFVRFVKPNELQTEIVSNVNERDEISRNLKKVANNNDDLTKELNKLSIDGFHPEVCYIDAGLVTELNEVNRVNFIALFNSLAEFDGYKAGELMIERSKTPETAIDEEIFALKVERLVDKIKQRTFTLGTVSIGDLLEKMLSMVRSHHVRMEGDFVSVVVAILLLEGIGRQLDPSLDLFARCVWFTFLNGMPDH
ncbi:hypothetical protein BN7_4237b [Wickerhamomyces ciferrii]|uniref:Protein kinase domain-containing protein n=1 Tax=Wickerhamomyces ciferrii (strain ATCC 14091 / BCRC 22168 / CBS 111 / JCM 3599 / NBRC 0793 / NRRL Y-1031 F-60-10) TaxID=1206466 RepID=K0KTG6_WICCF|nr:uncharacterized protein BN7_4237b [Wickerhamomyces ciferrii]CCH44669.1 hypothetical protein BN7_4237b [Wickerhamomyces ciferrii]